MSLHTDIWWLSSNSFATIGQCLLFDEAELIYTFIGNLILKLIFILQKVGLSTTTIE